MKQTEKNFSLKDQLFNQNKVSYLSWLILWAYPEFPAQQFEDEVMAAFPKLELLDRIHYMVDMLEKHLSISPWSAMDYPHCLNILLSSLPAPLDPNKHDDDFWDFIMAPYGYFVAQYGCSEQYLEISFAALEEMTKRFSCEWAIRAFFKHFELQTLRQMLKWSQSDNYHVRRLASEGSRPSLPWGNKIALKYNKTLPILDNLCHDTRRFVTRSVANHLNDISKLDPKLVVDTLKRWQIEQAQDIDYIISHATRTLVKQWDHGALELLGYNPNPNVSLEHVQLNTTVVIIGNALEFGFDITAHSREPVIIDYSIHFVSKSWKLLPKVFKLKKLTLSTWKTVHISKNHPFKLMTTKALYPGLHKLDITVNGKTYIQQEFELKTS